jgi:GDPmannose 4,6-dehydratase
VDVRPGAALRRALITGSRGQDGSYLVELLAGNGYDVVGVDRGDTDLAARAAVERLLRDAQPHELYNLAAPSFVPASWDDPEEALRVAGVGVGVILAAIAHVDPAIRFFQASSAEVFGTPVDVPQSEATPYRPRSPYAAAKACADFLVASYREHRGLHASCGILFNHESPRRPAHFLPAKVAHAAAAIAAGREHELVLGDLEAERDWGYAPDYVDAMWRIVRHDEPGDYVVATGECHTVRELVAVAFDHVGLDWRDHVRVDASLVRGSARRLVGDASKARRVLGWAPSIGFEQLVRLLVDAARTHTAS